MNSMTHAVADAAPFPNKYQFEIVIFGSDNGQGLNSPQSHSAIVQVAQGLGFSREAK